MENREKVMKKGFTILEILVVISVIAILIGIAIPRFKGMQDEANIIKVKSDLKTIQAAMESYKNNTGAYAVTKADLSDLEGATPKIINDDMEDPLSGTAYRIITNSPYYVIFAWGVDGDADTTAVSATTGEVTTNSGDYCVTNGSGC